MAVTLLEKLRTSWPTMPLESIYLRRATKPRPLQASRPFSSSGALRRRAPQAAKIPNTSIRVFREVGELRQWRRRQLLEHRSVGLVPTMGALHAGHASLVRLAAAANHRVVVSVYVNPAQFGAHEDLAGYPRTWEADCAALAALDRDLAGDGANLGAGIAAVFAPATAAIYPSGRPGQEAAAKGSFATVTPLAERLEGASRPTFFRGVATVCTKLFNIVTPERVYFGQKDVQQTVVIKKLVKDFCIDTEVVVGPTTRESDGLAMSSRNVYLGQRRRKIAIVLSKMLRTAEAGYKGGARDRNGILGPAEELADLLLLQQAQLPARERALFELDYISLADPETLEELNQVDESRGAIISGAVRMLPVEEPQDGEDLGLNNGPLVRLIDNIILEPIEKQ